MSHQPGQWLVATSHSCYDDIELFSVRLKYSNSGCITCLHGKLAVIRIVEC